MDILIVLGGVLYFIFKLTKRQGASTANTNETGSSEMTAKEVLKRYIYGKGKGSGTDAPEPKVLESEVSEVFGEIPKTNIESRLEMISGTFSYDDTVALVSEETRQTKPMKIPVIDIEIDTKSLTNGIILAEILKRPDIKRFRR